MTLNDSDGAKRYDGAEFTVTAVTKGKWWEFGSLALGYKDLHLHEPTGPWTQSGFYLWKDKNGVHRLTFIRGWAAEGPREHEWDADEGVSVNDIRSVIARMLLKSDFVRQDEDLAAHLRLDGAGWFVYGPWTIAAQWIFNDRDDSSWDPPLDNLKDQITRIRTHRGQWAAEKLRIGGSGVMNALAGAPVDEIAAALTGPVGRRIARGNLLQWAATCPLLAEGYEVDVLAGLLAD